MKLLNILLVFILSFTSLQLSGASVSYEGREPATTEVRIKKEKKTKKQNAIPKAIKSSLWILFVGVLIGALGSILISASFSSGVVGAFWAGLIIVLFALIICCVAALVLSAGIKKAKEQENSTDSSGQ